MKMKETVKIEGMMCGHCEAAVRNRWRPLTAWIARKCPMKRVPPCFTLSKEVADADVRKAVEDKDYKFVSIEK